MEQEKTATDGTGFGHAFSDLAGEIGTMVRQEVEVARCELAEAAREARAGAVMCGMGVCTGLAAGSALMAAAVLGLTLLLRQGMSTLAAACLSALIVGVVLGVGAWLFVRQGSRELSPARFVPRRALQSLKENVRWARERM